MENSMDFKGTFESEKNLPSLPVPNLDQTLDYYLKSVKPVVTEQEYHECKNIINNFKNGIGIRLHEYLVEKSKVERNWLEKWWEDVAYLQTRTPHAPFVNTAGAFILSIDFWSPKKGSQIERASLVTWYTLKFWDILKKEQLDIDKNNRGDPFSMFQYSRLFNCCKIPGQICDSIKASFRTEKEGNCPHHLIVICFGRYFKIEVLNDKGELITPMELHLQLKQIKITCQKLGKGCGVGAMTAEYRTTWYKVRNHLIDLSPINKDILNLIETSIFMISLDEASPTDINQCTEESLFGNAYNRWFDKSAFIFFENGYIGQNCDHSPIDAMPLVSMGIFIYNQITKNHVNRDEINQQDVNNYQPKDYHVENSCFELKFVTDDDIKLASIEAEQLYRYNCSNIDIKRGEFNEFGKNFFRKYQLHPDACVQLSIQLAYKKLYDRSVSTYETATTRRFFHGRTETIRSCTIETNDFSNSINDSTIKMHEKYRKFKIAHDTHVVNSKRCSMNQGCDRHLLGLYLISLEKHIPIHEIFTHSSYSKSGGGGNFILSTSFTGYNRSSGGVAPMCQNGYGCFYSMSQDIISIFVSSWRSDAKTSSEKFYQSLCDSLLEIRSLIEMNDNIFSKI